ncbi:MAG: HAMP domain-containing protein [Actinomycetia bacterium]|nr:HAMP domain-containing protein [Actinomycetes bacterium]
MSKLLRRIPLKVILGLLAVIPLLGMSLFALGEALGRRAEASAAGDVEELIQLSVRVGEVLHETQKERGASAVYMSSDGARFGSELRSQQTQTDVAVVSLMGLLDEHENGLPADITALLAHPLAELDRIESQRGSALSLAVPTGEIVGYYTALNEELLRIVAVAGTAADDPVLLRDGLSYGALLNAKERAGIGRAQLASVFVNDTFTPSEYRAIVANIAAEESFLTLLTNMATPEIITAFGQMQSGSEVAEVARLQAIALDADITSESFAGFGVDGATWFDTATDRIGLFKDLEDLQAELMIDGAAQLISDANGAFRQSMITAGVVMVLTAAIVYLVMIDLVQRLQIIAERARAISRGELDHEPIHNHCNDEIGEVADSFNEMVSMLSTVGSQAKSIADGEISASVLDEKVPGELGDAFSTMVGSLKTMVDQLQTSSQQLAGAAEELTAVSSAMGSSAEQTSSQATTASTTGDQVSSSVATVAAAIEEMNASIREVALNATDASNVASDAVSVARATSDSISKLGESSEEIGNVIKVINSIAEQTNLLALNATIEAARAGEAGKGFAVVANEVKELANQTAEATEEISSRVRAIQADTEGAVTANVQIGETIDRINEISATIASAVEEQSVTTAEIGRSVDQAAAGTQEIASTITAVAEAAENTRQSTDETKTSAEEMAHMAAGLNQLVSNYR